jgi:hypothetical protein
MTSEFGLQALDCFNNCHIILLGACGRKAIDVLHHLSIVA